MRKIMAVGALILTSFLPNNRTAYADSCDGGLVDLFGGAAIGTSATALVAGESALIIVGTSGVAVLTAPAVAVGATVTAVAGSIVYAGHKTWCWMTDWLATKHFLNEDTEAISEDWKPTGKILKAGTPIFLAGYHMWDEDIDHGSYDPKKISYASVVEESNGDSYYIPSNSLNALYAEEYTHILNKDSRVWSMRWGMDPNSAYDVSEFTYPIPKNHPVKVFKVRKDGWVKLELADGSNMWLPSIDDLSEIKIEMQMEASK